MGTLILLRHGQSQWNLENRFAGWTDIPLTEQGTKDASTVGQALAEFKFDCAFTSRLIRAQNTLNIVLTMTGQNGIPVIIDSALNERHYGDLQGLNKAETAEKYGQEQVLLWRRSFSTRPPGGESIEDCERRTWPFFKEYIFPHLINNETVLVAAHGNSLRPIIKNLDNISGDDVAAMEIGLCTPYIYKFEGGQVVSKDVREMAGIAKTQAATEMGKAA